MKHICTLAMTRATELFQIVSEKSRVSLQGTVSTTMGPKNHQGILNTEA